MKKKLVFTSLSLLFILITIVFFMYKSRSNIDETKSLLLKANAEAFTFKYEFEEEPYSLLLFKNDGMFFRVEKKNIELMEYDKDLKDGGGITFVLNNQKRAGTYKITRNLLGINGGERKEVREDLAKILDKYKLNQRNVYDYLINYAKNNLIKELEEDKKSLNDLIRDNNYKTKSIENIVSISSSQYALEIQVNNQSKIENVTLYDKGEKDISFIISLTNSLGKNLISISNSSTIYDLDKGTVIRGTVNLSKSQLEKANILKDECYKMLRYLHVNNIESLLKLYESIK